MTGQLPETISQIKAKVPSSARARQTGLGVALFALSTALYTVSFVITLMPVPVGVRLLASCINGGFIALLFIIGHDACHGSLTSQPWLNKALGRLAFLASWHPFLCWDLGHNRIHHSWTNLRGRDYVWTPLTTEEYNRLPAGRRLLERFYRTLPGVGFYYLWEIWFKHMVFPRAADRKRMSTRVMNADRFLVAVFITAQIAAAFWSASRFQTPVWLALTLAVILPQLLWNALMGLVILLHHTHPAVRWFDNADEWSFYDGQVRGTVHVIFPWPIGAILHHIMEHTAHHIDPRIPLYQLTGAQKAVAEAFPADVIQSHFTLGNLRQVLRECQLYDYRRHQWLTFAAARATRTRQQDQDL